MSPSSTHPGIVHLISRSKPGNDKPLVAFEHCRLEGKQPQPKNIIIFLGGITDGLLTVPFSAPLASALPSSWRLVEPILSSAYRQFGISSLKGDVAEIAQIVEYFRKLNPEGKVVLQGHSTGSQQTMTYLLSEPKLQPIDGGIMQASASDREAVSYFISQLEYDSACKLAQSFVDEGRPDDVLPFSATKTVFQNAPISARRWLSLASPGPDHAGEDDLFSSDFDDKRLARTFGKLGKTGTRVAFLFSGEDQLVPESIDKAMLVERWHKHVKQGGGTVDEASGVVEMASHTLEEGGDALDDVVKRIVGFLGRLDGKAD